MTIPNRITLDDLPTMPVGEIAARVGYGSQSAFTAALVRARGCTPRALRRELRDKIDD